MKVFRTKVDKMVIKEVKGLDTINVYFEDFGPRYGKTTIEVFGESWSYGWGGLGDRNMEEFFVKAGVDYLAQKLAPDCNRQIESHSGVRKCLFDAILEGRKLDYFDKKRARELWDLVEDYIEDDAGSLSLDHSVLPMDEILGDEWWYSLPKEDNPKYVYLCRIIVAIQDALLDSATSTEE